MASSIAAMVESYRDQLDLTDTSYLEDIQTSDDDSNESEPSPLRLGLLRRN